MREKKRGKGREGTKEQYEHRKIRGEIYLKAHFLSLFHMRAKKADSQAIHQQVL